MGVGWGLGWIRFRVEVGVDRVSGGGSGVGFGWIRIGVGWVGVGRVWGSGVVSGWGRRVHRKSGGSGEAHGWCTAVAS